MKQRHLSAADIGRICDNSPGDLVVVSGGEPFEHPDLGSILAVFDIRQHAFRIATGGHIDLSPWMQRLQGCSSLDGVSVGTDVILETHAANRRQWHSNILRLRDAAIPVSMTFTAYCGLNSDHIMQIREVLASLGEIDFLDFFYVVKRDSRVAKALKGILMSRFPGIRIVEDDGPRDWQPRVPS